jgi:hypothetical protein
LCFGEFFLYCGNHYERKFSHKCVFARIFSHFARRGIKAVFQSSHEAPRSSLRVLACN